MKCNRFVMLPVTLGCHPLTLTIHNIMKRMMIIIIIKTNHYRPYHRSHCHRQIMGNRATAIHLCEQSTILKEIIIPTTKIIIQLLIVTITENKLFLLQLHNYFAQILYFLSHIIILQDNHLLHHQYHNNI